MLVEAGVTSSRMTSDVEERPLKRPRSGRRPEDIRAEAARLGGLEDSQEKYVPKAEQSEDDDEEDIEFEDVEIPKPTIQTTYLSSEEDSDSDEDIQFEDVNIQALVTKEEEAGNDSTDQETGTLQLNLTTAKATLTPSKQKKQPLTKEEKERRILIHKAHLLLLLSVVEQRNHWCNDGVVQTTLRPLLPAKTVKFLNPGSSLTQFGQTESLKRGLTEAQEIFRERFKITEIGMRRALWAEDESDLSNVECPKNSDSCGDKVTFRKAARTLKGSRDVGALLFCALLRAVGVEARLVCSLQPLSFVPGGPTLPKARKVQTSSRPAPVTPASQPRQAASSAFPSPIRSRLGHPNATAYQIPRITPPRVVEWEPSQRKRANLHIIESEYPVFWTEILDVGHQKWQPIDALVTGTLFRPHKLEPPLSDRQNILTYVVAMEDDGATKDVTRRYAKAYTAKTRRFRIDGPLTPPAVGGAKWWRRALKRYKPRVPSDLDQIEDTELNAAEAREPMPRNVSDFKNHPIYALERHLRRHEILVPGAKAVGTVGAGSKGPLEKIYRRQDVRITKSVDKWYRMGREIIPGEEPLKVLPKRKSTKRKGRFRHLDESAQSSDDDDDDPILGPDPAKGVPHFAYEQTQLYVPPPVVGGRIPKNRFKNLDVYVPSMVPAGGFHFKHPRAGHAAHILGVDYAPALQGFEFKGRQGTAVYNGVVIPVEAVEAVRAVITGFQDLEAQLEEESRSRRALEMWRSWMRTLTIRSRLFEGDDYWGDTELGEFDIPPEEEEVELEEAEEEGEYHGGHRRRRPRVGLVLDEEDEGGGFEPGGFEPEPGGFESGGFEPGGFEREDYAPGGFEQDFSGSGGFESGGFEVQADIKGKGKASEPPGLVPTTNDSETQHAAGIDGADEDMTEEPGGYEVGADVEMADTYQSPAAETTTTVAQEPESLPQLPIGEVAQVDTNVSVARHGLRSSVATPAAAVPDAEPEEVDSVDGKDTAVAPSPDQSEDTEMAEAPSDVTEEFFMDEDGTLVD
ncbi:unnamed protein product [Discula destructiva]